MGGAAGESPYADCPGLDLQMDGVLDLDLQAVQIAGAVTLNGAALPTETLSRGYIEFVDAENATRAAFDLGASGPGAYALTLPPGKYAIHFAPSLTLCTDPTTAASLMPCGSGTLVPELDVQADGVLDLDIPAVYVSGAVTLNGAAFPAENEDRGAVLFTGADEVSVISRGLGGSGPASYSVGLLPGQYDIVFAGNPLLCQGTAPSSVPCNSGLLQSNFTAVTGVLNLDVSAVTLSGAVTLAGAALPTETLGRGAISFTKEDSTIISRDLGTTGPGAYAVTVLPGVYDVGFAGNPELCHSGAAPQVPCNSGVVHAATQFNADGVLDVNVTAVTISGPVTLNDAVFPAQATERGAIFFENEQGSASSASLGMTGAAAYQVTLLPGTYDVSYQPGLECDSASLAPCNGGELVGAQAFAASGVLDLNVPSVHVSGAVTVNGATPTDHTLPRGQLVFVSADGTAARTTEFSATGPISYGISLFPGSYSVGFGANPASCGAGSVPSTPCVGGPLLGATSFTADGVLDIDIPSIFVSGAVTLRGGTLPTETQSRGAISFTLLEDADDADLLLAGSGSSADLGMTGASSYGISLLPGRYAIAHAANPALCGPGLISQVPCAPQVLLGCD